MLNVEKQNHRINASFLEPACGNGNFLIEILKFVFLILLMRPEQQQTVEKTATYFTDFKLPRMSKKHRIFYGIPKKVYLKKKEALYKARKAEEDEMELNLPDYFDEDRLPITTDHYLYSSIRYAVSGN